MWKILSNIVSESLQAISVLMGSHDHARELKKTINSAERFVNWGKESHNIVDYQEAVDLLEKTAINNANSLDKIKILNLKSAAYIGIIAAKENDMAKFNLRISKKYDSDEFMNEVINNIALKMKDLQTIISVAESGDTEKLKMLLGDKKTLDVRPEEISLDSRKEYETVEDSFIMKKSIKENKSNEIKHFKDFLANDIEKMQEKVLTLILDFDNLEDYLTTEEKVFKNKSKEEIQTNLALTINILKDKGIPIQSNRAKK